LNRGQVDEGYKWNDVSGIVMILKWAITIHNESINKINVHATN